MKKIALSIVFVCVCTLANAQMSSYIEANFASTGGEYFIIQAPKPKNGQQGPTRHKNMTFWYGNGRVGTKKLILVNPNTSEQEVQLTFQFDNSTDKTYYYFRPLQGQADPAYYRINPDGSKTKFALQSVKEY